jgi:hypothetical protein
MQTLYSVSGPSSLGLAFRTLHLIDTCLFAAMQPNLYYSPTHCTRTRSEVQIYRAIEGRRDCANW